MLDVLVVGGGVVGLSIARTIQNKRVYLIEKEKSFGQGTSSRSSEVVHAGIYYAKDSKKARFCVQGRRLLKAYCRERNIPYDERGKLIVATCESQVSGLDKVAQKAKENGVGDEKWENLIFLNGEQARKMEPELSCLAALFSPSTAVINSHLYMANLEEDCLEAGVNFVYGSSFKSATLLETHPHPLFEVEVLSSSGNVDKVTCSTIINCAGLYAPDVARSIRTNHPKHDQMIPQAYYCKGSYFKLQGVKNPFQKLIYPTPETHGLGVHLTINTEGAARFGPDIEFIPYLNIHSYNVDPKRADSFYSKIRRYWPALPDNSLVPDYAGIRPKLGPAEQPALDFQIWDRKVHGVSGLIHLLGIESPGLTSSLALANYVSKMIE